MSLWIVKNTADLIKKAVKDKGFSEFILQTISRATISNPNLYLSMGFVRTHGDFLVPKSCANEVYASYADFESNNKTYTIKNYIPIWIDSINNVKFIDGENKRAIFINKDGEKFYVHNKYAQSKIGDGWFFDQKNLVYTDVLPDYPAFNSKYKGSPRNWKVPNKEEVFGHEWELKFPSYGRKIDFAEEIKDSWKPCICEKDGSLDGGSPDGPSLELITPPWSYDESINNLLQLSDLARYYGGLGHMAGVGYAWHITVNINNAENPILAGSRFCCLINDPKLNKFWRSMSRRANTYNVEKDKDYAKFENLTVENALSKERWAARWQKDYPDHYYATFYRKGGHSIELRIIRSTLNKHTIQGTLEVVRTAWLFSKTDIEITPRNWYNWLEDNLSPLAKGVLNKVGAKDNLVKALYSNQDEYEIILEEV